MAGFIGSHTAAALLDRSHAVTGIDSLNAYYDPALKQARLARLSGRDGFRFVQADIADAEALTLAAAGESYDVILHLAAQADVTRAARDFGFKPSTTLEKASRASSNGIAITTSSNVWTGSFDDRP